MKPKAKVEPLDLDEPLMTTGQVAALLNTTVNTVKWWRHAGTGPDYFKPNGTLVRYRREDVLSWLAQQYEATSTATAVAE